MPVFGIEHANKYSNQINLELKYFEITVVKFTNRRSKFLKLFFTKKYSVLFC